MVWEDCNYKQEKDEGDGRQNPLVVLLAGIPDLELEALLDYLPIKDEVDQAPASRRDNGGGSGGELHRGTPDIKHAISH